jgi:hypothetical protein
MEVAKDDRGHKAILEPHHPCVRLDAAATAFIRYQPERSGRAVFVFDLQRNPLLSGICHSRYPVLSHR